MISTVHRQLLRLNLRLSPQEALERILCEIQKLSRKAQPHQRMGLLMLAPGYLIIAVSPIIAILVVYIIYKGAPALSWEFITGFPSDGMRSGGIWPAIGAHFP